MFESTVYGRRGAICAYFGPKMKTGPRSTACVLVGHIPRTEHLQLASSAVHALWERQLIHTLQVFLHPTPLRSSAPCGGLHLHFHSNSIELEPSVQKSPIRLTLGFLCRFGSAWNSRVTRFSRSLPLDAIANVSPLMFVSATVPLAGSPRCLMLNLKLKKRSSSLDSFNNNGV